MANQPNDANSPWYRKAINVLRQRCESYPVLGRLSTVVMRWLPTDTNTIVNKPPRAVFTETGNLWPCSEFKERLKLSFSFFGLADNIIQRNRESKVQTALKHIEEQVPGIEFNRVDKVRDAVIRIAFDHEHPVGKNWSRVGVQVAKVDSDKPTMNLSGVTGHDSGDIKVGSKEYGLIVHEFLHTLGMLHEHQHPNRNYTISGSAVKKNMQDDGCQWSGMDIYDNIERKLKPDEVSACSPIDILSCMNYRISPEWTNDGSEVQKNNKPSALDLIWLNLVYPPPDDPKKFEQALAESMDSHISKEHRDSILKLYLDGEWDRLRTEIARISNPRSKSSKKGFVESMIPVFLSTLFVTYS